MNCSTCRGKSEQAAECFQTALNSLKDHFLMMQNLCIENSNVISTLKQRNEKLHKAIELLHQKQESHRLSSPKRRRCSPKKSQQKAKPINLPQTDSPKVPESQSSLNMNIALQPDDEEEEETITETEPAISPYKPWTTRRKLNKLNCENVRPDSTIRSDKQTDWLAKLPKESLPLAKTKMSLTLRSNSPKLKQTRLHFDANKSNKEDSDKEVIESSPNLYTALKKAKHSQSLLQRSDKGSVLDVNCNASVSTKKTNTNNNQPVFDMDDDDSFFELCPDPTAPKSPSGMLPALSGSSNTSSVVLLTPATQDIVFINDSIEETNQALNTLDFMAEAIKDNDKASTTKLQEYEAKLIKEQQEAAAKVRTATNVKLEQLTEQPSGSGNESTKLPEDFQIDGDDDEAVEEEPIPRPILIKQECENEYSIDCDQCQKFINFMGASMTDIQIREHLSNCRHFDERELDNNTPDGFWNPHLVSFAEDDPRSKVHVDRRFVNQRKK